MTWNRRQFLGGVAALGLASRTSAWAAQGGWPTRPVTIVVPYPPGGSSDIIARLVSQPLSVALGQTVVVENKPGANGNLGAGLVAQSAQQGHTLLLCDVGALAISPSVYRQLSFDPSQALGGVSMLAYSPHVLAVHPSTPADSLGGLIALSQRQTVNLAVPAVGSAPHLAAVAVQEATGAQWQYVPYKGGAQALTDAVGGQVHAILNGLLATLPHIRQGRLRALAISRRERMDAVKDIPTIAEQGVPGFESGTWQGVMAPAAMPPPIADRLADLLAQIIRRPELAKSLSEQGAEVVIQNPAEMMAFFHRERVRWAKVVERADVRLD